MISGNGNNGVLIQGPGSTENRVEGNYIGINATGTVAIGNNVAVNISEGASHNIMAASGAATAHATSSPAVMGPVFRSTTGPSTTLSEATS